MDMFSFAPNRSKRIARFLVLVPQFILLTLFWLLGEAAAYYGRIPLPRSIVGMFFLLAALGLRIVPVSAVEAGSHFLLREMLLFFIPAVLIVLDHPEFLGTMGLKLLAIIVVSTLIVMAATGATIDLLSRRTNQENGR